MISLFTISKAKLIESISLILTIFHSLESKLRLPDGLQKKKLKLIKMVCRYLKI